MEWDTALSERTLILSPVLRETQPEGSSSLRKTGPGLGSEGYKASEDSSLRAQGLSSGEFAS